MKRPAGVYVASKRAYRGLPDVSYPLHDRDIVVTACGRVCMHRKKIHVSTALANWSSTSKPPRRSESLIPLPLPGRANEVIE
jgi:hypothetical protein